jgi:hypothetical protein
MQSEQPLPRKNPFGFLDKTHSESAPANVEFEEESEEQIDESMNEAHEEAEQLVEADEESEKIPD